MSDSLRKYPYSLSISIFCILLLNACASSPPPIETMTLTPERLSRQSMQTRYFETDDMNLLLRSVMSVVQDQHYMIREVNTKYGILFADQTYDIGTPISLFGIPLTHVHQGARGPSFAVSFGPLSLGDDGNHAYLAKKITAISTVIYPSSVKKGYDVKVSIEMRSFYNTGELGKISIIKDPKLYQQFFNAVSKAAYLQANSL